MLKQHDFRNTKTEISIKIINKNKIQFLWRVCFCRLRTQREPPFECKKTPSLIEWKLKWAFIINFTPLWECEMFVKQKHETYFKYTYQWMPDEREMNANLVWPSRLNFNLSTEEIKKKVNSWKKLVCGLRRNRYRRLGLCRHILLISTPEPMWNCSVNLSPKQKLYSRLVSLVIFVLEDKNL